MKEEITTVYIGKGQLDNDYTFYKDGSVEHFYDQSAFKLNQKNTMQVSNIDENLRAKILQKCPSDALSEIQELFLRYPAKL